MHTRRERAEGDLEAARAAAARAERERRVPWLPFLRPAAWTLAATVVLVGVVVYATVRFARPVVDADRRPPSVPQAAPDAQAPSPPRRGGEARGEGALDPALADPTVAAIERRRVAGELSEVRRRPGDCVVERTGWIDGTRSRIHRVDERREDGLVVRRWFGDDGRLVAAAAGSWSTAGTPPREQGAAGPLVRELALSVRDASDALFGPPRGCDAAR